MARFYCGFTGKILKIKGHFLRRGGFELEIESAMVLTCPVLALQLSGEGGNDRFIVRIPEPIFIGHSDEKFQMVMKTNEILSFVTADIDPAESIARILDKEAKVQRD